MARPGAESRLHRSGLGARSSPEDRISRLRRLPDAAAYCLEPRHLRRTVAVAVVVGLVLTAINHLDAILAGGATGSTWLKCGLNFLVPFVVANVGLLSAVREAPR